MVEKASLTARAVANLRLRKFHAGGDVGHSHSEGEVAGTEHDKVEEVDGKTAEDRYWNRVLDSPIADRVDEVAARDYYQNPDSYKRRYPIAVRDELARIRKLAERYENRREWQKEKRQKGLVARRYERAQDLQSPYEGEGPPNPARELQRIVQMKIRKYKLEQKQKREIQEY